MERFGTGGNLSCQRGPLPEVVLFDRSVQSDLKLRFRFQKCSFPVPLQLVTTVKMADCSDVSVYECSVCKPQMQDLNFLLMHSCTQGSGTAVHLNLFFLLVFCQFLKTNILLASPHFDDVFPRFSLSSMWPYVKFKDEFGKSHITQQSIRSDFCFGCFPFSHWLIRVVSNRSVRYNGKHLWSNHSFN